MLLTREVLWCSTNLAGLSRKGMLLHVHMPKHVQQYLEI